MRAGKSQPHKVGLLVRIEQGHTSIDAEVECPDAALGAARPCAVWANEDGTEREDECTFQQYAEASAIEDWLHGEALVIGFATECGSGDDWHAKWERAVRHG